MDKHTIPAVGSIPLSKLTTNDLQQFYGKLKKEGRMIRTEVYGSGVSDCTVWLCHVRIRAALEQVVKDKFIRINPAADCKLPPQKAQEITVLTWEEMQRLLIQAKEEGYFELFPLDISLPGEGGFPA